MKLILASQSPRRKEILALCNIPFEIIVADIDETINYNNDLKDEITKLSYRKAKKIADTHFNDVVIGSDTIVVINNEVLGKPKDEIEAKEMLKKISNKTHQVITGVSILYQDEINSYCSISDVTFKKLGDEEIDKYILTKEPLDKAGAYAIQGKGGCFITNINGDYYSIMGLPLNFTYETLKKYFK